MRIFIGHKFQNAKKEALKEKIERIASLLKEKGYRTFNYFRDRENWELKDFPPGKVMKEAFEELRKSDLLFLFIDGGEMSRGIYLEVGFAKALDKKIILLIKKSCSEPTLEALADEVIKFDNWEEVSEKLKSRL